MRLNLRRIWILAAFSANAWAQHDDLEVTLTPAARQFCHIIQFPRAWTIQRSDDKTGQALFFGTNFGDYEFRVDGPVSTQFLVAGFTEFVATRYYTTNRFRVDLSNASVPILEVSRENWDSGTVVPFTRRSAFGPGQTVQNERRLEFNGFQFNRTGEIWAQPSDYATPLSPDKVWVVLQSEAIKSTRGLTKVFFDFFNLKTGQKAFTIDGAFSSQISDGAEQMLKSTGWITERYFIAPLARFRERALVCEFGATGPAASKK